MSVGIRFVSGILILSGCKWRGRDLMPGYARLVPRTAHYIVPCHGGASSSHQPGAEVKWSLFKRYRASLPQNVFGIPLAECCASEQQDAAPRESFHRRRRRRSGKWWPKQTEMINVCILFIHFCYLFHLNYSRLSHLTAAFSIRAGFSRKWSEAVYLLPGFDDIRNFQCNSEELNHLSLLAV